MHTDQAIIESVKVKAGGVVLDGDLTIPEHAVGVVAFAHGSGSSRHSRRNRLVAGMLNDASLATLLLDLLTVEEDAIDERMGKYRFDIPRLGDRMTAAVDWLAREDATSAFPIGLFGASTGSAAALIAAAARPEQVRAVVSRGGRPDLADDVLPNVKAPTLLIVGANDEPVIEMNQDAAAKLPAEKRLEIVAGATHLFEEPGKLQEVARLAADWFQKYLPARK